MTENRHIVTTIELPDDYEGKVVATLVRLPSEKSSSSAVIYIHGYLDYYFQYHMGEYFASQGRNFYALDLRKYGRSWMKHQHFNYARRMEEYFPDIDAAVDFVIAEGNTDITLLGHSTGGLLSALYCAKGARRAFINRLILNSPFLEFNVGWFVRDIAIPVAGVVGTIFPYATTKSILSPNYFKSLHISQYGEWDFDRELKPEKAPPIYLAWLRAVRLAQKEVKRGLDIPVPVLIMFSDKSSRHKRWNEESMVSDTILNVDHIMYYGTRLGDNVTLEEIADGMHDLVLSRADIRERVLTSMEYFIEKTSVF